MAPTAVAVPDTPSRELIEQRTDSSVRIIMPDLPPGEEDASAWGWSWPSGPDSVPIAVTIDGVPADSSTLGDPPPQPYVGMTLELIRPVTQPDTTVGIVARVIVHLRTRRMR